MSTDDSEILLEPKRIESVNTKTNRNAQKRRKRAEAKKALKNEKDENRLKEIRAFERAPGLWYQQEALKAAEIENERLSAQLKQQSETKKRRRDADPSIVATSNAKRLKGSEKKDAEETKRSKLAKEQQIERGREKQKRHWQKKKCDEDELLVFILNNTTTQNYLYQVEQAVNDIIAITKSENKYISQRLLELGIIDAFFACLHRFPTETWLHLLGLQVITGLTRSLYDVNDNQRLPWSSLRLRSTYEQLSKHNACAFVLDIAVKYPLELDVAQECMEVWFRLIRFHDELYSPPPPCMVFHRFVNPNINDVCRHLRMESVVVQLFNEHEPKSSTDVFARHCIALIDVFASNDLSATYRPEMCHIVSTTMQKYSDNSAILTTCNTAIASLSKNIENKQQLEAFRNLMMLFY